MANVTALPTTVSTSVYNNTPGFLAVLLVPMLVMSWPSCWEGEENKEKPVICMGLCTKTITNYQNLTTQTIYGCQNEQNYPASVPDKCTDVQVSFPNVIVYTDKENNYYYKYCCSGKACNKNGYKPIMPVRKEASEAMKEMDLIEVFLISLMFLCIAAAPIIYVYRNNRETRLVRTHMDSPMDEKLLRIQNRPTMEKFYVPQLITGRLHFHELVKLFRFMDTYVPSPAQKVPKDARITYKHYIAHCGGQGHGLVKATREVLVRYDNPVWALLEQGPYIFPWRPLDLVEIFDRAKDLFEADSTLLHLSLPMTIIGDVRGQYTDLHRWLYVAGMPPSKKLLFLGGVVDPNEYGSLDCLALVAALKIEFPHSVFMLRGIGESIPLHFGPRFGPRNDSAILSSATRMCNYLPIGARISQTIFAVHSGLSHLLSNPQCFSTVKRPNDAENLPDLTRQLVFSQPSPHTKMYRFDSETNCGYFGLGAVDRVCHDMRVKLIVRSRNPVPDGHAWISDRMISLWSAPGKEAEKGSIITINEQLVVSIQTLCRQVTDDPTQPSGDDAAEKTVLAPDGMGSGEKKGSGEKSLAQQVAGQGAPSPRHEEGESKKNERKTQPPETKTSNPGNNVKLTPHKIQELKDKYKQKEKPAQKTITAEQIKTFPSPHSSMKDANKAAAKADKGSLLKKPVDKSRHSALTLTAHENVPVDRSGKTQEESQKNKKK